MQNDIKILLYTQANVEYDVSYITEIPMSLNLLIADVRQPDKRNSTFSKTINLPGTKEVNEFFELIWKTNINLQTFNPNLKCKVYYYINGVEQIKGDLQLLRINVNDETSEVIYECSIVGRLGNLFLAFGDSLLTDLDFSEFNHNLTKANVTDSWATQIQVSGSPVAYSLGYGYTYPLINFGRNGGNVSEYKVKDFKPVLFKKTILDKCMTLANFTYSSAYFNSTYYKSLTIPTSAESLILTPTEINNNQFYAGVTSTGYDLKLVAQVLSDFKLDWTDTVLFNNDSTLPFNDAGNIYNTGTGETTIVNTNLYNITGIVEIELKAFAPVLATHYRIFGNNLFLDIEKFSSGSWSVIGTSQTVVSTNSNYIQVATSLYYQLSVGLNNYNLNAGEKIRVKLRSLDTVNINVSGLIVTFYTNPFPNIYNVMNGVVGNYGLSIRYTGSKFYANYSSNVIIEGSLVNMNQVLPINTKIIDWFMNEVYLGNLYMEESKTTENQTIIEDRDNFYTGELDLTEKRDISEKRVVTPMGDLDWKRYDFTYKKDDDYYNTLYFDEFKEVYGTGFYEIQNDFIKAKQKKELIYSATPLVGNYVNGLVVPTIYKVDANTIRPMKSNIRHLYYGGIINLSFGSWTLKSSLSGDTVYTTYPFAGDCNNPYTPTVSINWDTPKKIYYNYQLATYTDNNLKNRYYDRFVKQITDPNSKIELRHYVLNAYDIKQFSFRKVIFDTDAYFIVNAIKDYDVLKGATQSTPIELLKLTDYDAFTPSIIIPPPNENGGNERIINGNYSNGENNTNYGTQSRISGGGGNFIANGASSIELTNCNNVTVASNVVGFTGIGLSNINIDNTYSGRTIASVLGKLRETKTANFTVDPAIDIYFIDTSLLPVGTPLDIQFPDPSLNIDFEVTFVRLTFAENINALAFGAEVFGNTASPYTFIPSIGDKVTFITNGINWY